MEIILTSGAASIGNRLMSIEYFGNSINRTVLDGLLHDKPAMQISEDAAIPIDRVYKAQARWAAVLEMLAEPDSLPAIVK